MLYTLLEGYQKPRVFPKEIEVNDIAIRHLMINVAQNIVLNRKEDDDIQKAAHDLLLLELQTATKQIQVKDA